MRIPSLLRQVIAVGLVLFFSTACIGPFKRTPRAMQGLAKSYIVLQGKPWTSLPKSQFTGIPTSLVNTNWGRHGCFVTPEGTPRKILQGMGPG